MSSRRSKYVASVLSPSAQFVNILFYRQDERDPVKLRTFYDEKKKELEVLKRSAIVNQLYGGWRLVVEKQKPVRQRADS